MSDVNPKAVKLRKDTDKYTDEIKLQVMANETMKPERVTFIKY